MNNILIEYEYHNYNNFIILFAKHFYLNNFIFPLYTLQDLTVLPTEFFRRCKTHIPSVIILPTESKTEMICR